MFDIDSIKLLIQERKDKLDVLKQSLNVDQDQIDQLTEEVNYLEAAMNRGEIARLLKVGEGFLCAGPDFLGIEEEDVSKFNLSADELNQYNQCLANLPSEQLENFRIRKKLFCILYPEKKDSVDLNSVKGVEDIDPTMTKYGLSDEQIRLFNDLVNQLKGNSKDTTRYVNISSEIIRLYNDAFRKLDSADSASYPGLKSQYFDFIVKNDHLIGEEAKKQLFAGISNYEFASDLKAQYPDEEIKLTVGGVTDLVGALANLTVDSPKYNEYLELLGTSVKELYKVEANRDGLKQAIQAVDASNYLLRNDLTNKLSGLTGLSLELKDNELQRVMRYLDVNYHSLEEGIRNKYYNFVKNNISKNISDVDKVEAINKCFSNIRNTDLLERFKKDFADSPYAIFSNRHTLAYVSVVDNMKSKLSGEQSKHASKSNNFFTGDHHAVKAAAIGKQMEQMDFLYSQGESNFLINHLDESYNKKTEKIIALQKEINQLNAQKANNSMALYQKLIDAKISVRTKKINKLKASQVKIVGQQQKLMVPKTWLKRRKGIIARHYDAKQEVFNTKADGFKEMAVTERKFGGMFKGIKSFWYDLNAGVYKKRADFNQEVLDALRGGTVTNDGGNGYYINKNIVNQFRSMMNRNQNQAGVAPIAI